MKIICVDNFNREENNDRLVCENVNGFYGKQITEFLNNKHSGETSPVFFRLVDDDYELYVYEP